MSITMVNKKNLPFGILAVRCKAPKRIIRRVFGETDWRNPAFKWKAEWFDSDDSTAQRGAQWKSRTNMSVAWRKFQVNTYEQTATTIIPNIARLFWLRAETLHTNNIYFVCPRAVVPIRLTIFAQFLPVSWLGLRSKWRSWPTKWKMVKRTKAIYQCSLPPSAKAWKWWASRWQNVKRCSRNSLIRMMN